MGLKGVMPPMITPFKENGDVDLDSFLNNLLLWNEQPLSGYLVLGSNSETAFLSREEKLELIRLTAEYAGADRFIMAGTGVESIRETIELTNDAAKLGADGALVLTPGFYKSQMDSEAMIRYFTEIADHADIPVYIYNVPKFTGINIQTDAVECLSSHPNIRGIKDSTGDVQRLALFQKFSRDGFDILVGTAGAWYPALTLGIQGGIHALANCCPSQCAEVQKLFEQNKWKEARKLYERLLPVNEAVTAVYGIAGLKYACDLLGYHGGYVRSPLGALKESAKKDIECILKQAGILNV